MWYALHSEGSPSTSPIKTTSKRMHCEIVIDFDASIEFFSETEATIEMQQCTERAHTNHFNDMDGICVINSIVSLCLSLPTSSLYITYIFPTLCFCCLCTTHIAFSSFLFLPLRAFQSDLLVYVRR